MNIQPPARFRAWQCIGCGRIESQETCLGICQDRPVEVVSAYDYDALRARHDKLLTLLRKFVNTAPRNEEWERSYKGLQSWARKALDEAA